MTLIERIKENRANGTLGNYFCVVHDGDMIHIVTRDGDPVCSMGRVVCEEQKADSLRIASIPEMEAALLAAEELAKAVEELIAESAGVYGLHRNGALAPWESLTEGGAYEEWLLPLAAYREAAK